MKYVCKLVCICLLMCILFSCGQNKESIYVNRDGVLYEVADQVSFYYPKTFSIDLSKENRDIIQFVKDNEILTYSMVVDTSDNQMDELSELYEGELELYGAKDVTYAKKTLDSGNDCYIFTGYYGSTGMMFKHVVYFSLDATYVYAYQAPKDSYDNNIEVISKYLETLTIHYED